MDLITKAMDVVLSSKTVEQMEVAGNYLQLIEFDVDEDDYRGVIELYASHFNKILRQSNICFDLV